MSNPSIPSIPSILSINDERSPRQEIIVLLSKHIGLNINSVGHATINRAITKAIQLSETKTEVAYLQKLKASKQALQQLIELVVVPETHFFRNPESFAYLLKHIRQNQQNKENHKRLRVLSLPCSSGEEAYSIAMTLLEAGLEPAQFKIDGVDINQQGLSIANQGIYGTYSFRNTPIFHPQYYLNKYFSPVDESHYCIHKKIHSNVKFDQGNILEFDRPHQQSSYDIIFCRNLLIYFHDSARNQALDNLYHLLLPNGLIFFGYAETHIINPQKFSPLAIPQIFAFRKLKKKYIGRTNLLRISRVNLETLDKKGQPANPNLCQIKDKEHLFEQSIILGIKDKLYAKKKSKYETIIKQKCKMLKNQDVSPPSEITHIRELADHGNLDTALAQCDAYLKANPMSAEGYLLLGEVYQAQGSDERADMAFQRTLYLNPSCVEALNHRLLLCEQKADRDTAEQIRQRIVRLTQNQEIS